MSQVGPSSSHQLVAAAVAFRRARRKFPKNYGLCGNSEDTGKLDKTESLTVHEESNDQENSLPSSRKCSKPNRVDGKTVWSDECGESGSIKENLLQKPIICSCCRKRNDAARTNEPTTGFKTKDQCSAGDALDIVPSKEYNEIATKGDSFKSEQPDNSSDAKTTKCFITESRNSGRCRASYSHSRRRSPKETSLKLDSVNLLYDRVQDRPDNAVKRSSSSEKRNCNAEERSCNVGRNVCKGSHRNSRSKLNFIAPQKDNSSNATRTCDLHRAKHSTLDLLRPHRDCCRNQSRHRCQHPHDCCHHCCDEDSNSCSLKEKSRLASDTCLCSSNSTNHRGCCNKAHTACESICNHDCHQKNSKKISTVLEQNDEEYDDSIGTINHKDSLCILVEKYKASKKCKHRKYSGEAEFSDERAKDECNKSFTSETTCQMDENTNARQRGKYSDPRFRDNRSSIMKTCRHGCGQAFREGDCNQFKNLRSRLIKTGTCCSAKGTPWRNTF